MNRIVLLWTALLLLAGGADAFTTKKRDQATRPAFKSTAAPVMEPEAASHTAAFVPVPRTEEDDVSVGVAILSCAISLALGFGLGYGT